MRILAIETSCDETSAAVIQAEENKQQVKLLSNITVSSLNLHAKTGGIIPEIAAREQLKYILPVIKQALQESNLYPPSSKIHLPSSTLYRPDIDAIAVTIGPGLIGSLLVGVETAKTLAYVWNKPIIPVNHLYGHIYANWAIQKTENRKQRTEKKLSVNSVSSGIRHPSSVFSPPAFPALALIVSGGHTDLVLMKGHGELQWLGGTRDDAAGEAFDKIGRLLGLPYPAGPVISKLAEQGDSKVFNFPRPMLDSDDFDFSFSGLKTAVLYLMKKDPRLSVILEKAVPSPLVGEGQGEGKTFDQTLADLCASVEQAIIDVLIAKTLKAAQKYQVKSILLGGGVAANQKLRDELQFKIENLKLKISLSVPPKNLCTDNGAMIASAAFYNYKPVNWRSLTANPELYFE